MRGRRLRSAGLALLVSLGLSLSGAVLGGISAAPAFAASALAASLYPEPGVAAVPGEPFAVNLVVTNSGAEVAPSVVATLRLRSQPLLTVDDAVAWFGGDDSRRDASAVATIDVGDVPPGETVSVSSVMSLTEAEAGLGWQVLGLHADLDSGDATAAARSAVVWANGPTPGRGGFVGVVPLVAPANAADYLDATTLDALTKTGGLLQRQLVAATSAAVAAVDPRIVASIVRLGDKAPSTAQSWLSQLQSLPTPTFALQYGDADPAVQGQVGFSQLIPVSFAGMSTFESGQLGSVWAPKFERVVWAEPNTLTASAVTTIFSRTMSTRSDVAPEVMTSTTLLMAGSGNAGLPEGSRASVSRVATPSAPAPSVEALVLNDPLTSALRSAEQATTEASWSQSAAEAGTYLAIVASKGGGILAGGFSRTLPESQTTLRTADTLAYVRNLPWVSPESFTTARDQGPTQTNLVDSPESVERRDGGARVYASFTQLQNFSTASSQPELVSEYAGRTLSPLLGVAWNSDGAAWSDALSIMALSTRGYINDVHFGLTSNINMVGGQASIPITVVNGHSFDVTLSVHAVPSNPRLTVGEDQLVTIPADSQGTVKIPVAARVGNGDVNLTLSLASPSGEPVGEAVIVPVSVRADWEGFGLVIMAALFVALVIIGIIRTLRRRGRGSDAS
jgi:hypothetical protein